MELAIFLFNRDVVDGGVALLHEPLFVKEPIFVTVSTEPLALVVAVFVAESHGNSIAGVCPKLLDQTIVSLAIPLALEKVAYLIATFEKSRSIPPHGIGGICQLYLVGIL